MFGKKPGCKDMLENKLKSGRREPFEDLKEGRTGWEGNVKLFEGGRRF